MEDVEEKRLKSLEMLPSTGGAGERTFDSGIRVRMGVVQNVDGGNNIYSEPVEISYGDGNEEASPEERQEKIAALLQKDDKEWREQRRREKMGRYADASTSEEMQAIAKKEQVEIARENEIKAEAAGEVGISLEMLDPMDSLGNDSATDRSFKIKGRSASWFDDVDRELQQEMDATMGANGEGDDGPAIVGGKIVSRDKFQGVRVGSAGGWQLEIYPGDFVVHRKYGIGRFEKTVLQPKKNLSKSERDSQNKRREELLREEIESIGKGALTPEEIQEIMKKFGTAEDTDPLSNPQSTLLEIAYSDAHVHVPVERAYRLSRYRAGDSAIKPKLSRVKGGAWAKAKSKVEENTIVMAQDVLALYATREALTRPPCDPNLEAKVSKFEATFPFEPTGDQKTCFEQVENDMVWRGRPMDRLICGDVGFGKTEVAFRAIYRAVANGKQAAQLGGCRRACNLKAHT